jgi:hypothetical protein
MIADSGRPLVDTAPWPDLKVPAAPTLARIPPGSYEAVTVGLDAFSVFQRRALALWCDIYSGSALDGGTVLARIPAYFRLPQPGRPLSPSSKLCRLFDLVGPRPRRLDRLPMQKLRGKLFRVEVGDVVLTSEKGPDGQQRPMAAENVYSVIRTFVERLG